MKITDRRPKAPASVVSIADVPKGTTFFGTISKRDGLWIKLGVRTINLSDPTGQPVFGYDKITGYTPVNVEIVVTSIPTKSSPDLDEEVPF